jgi:hypothetical protein
MKGLPIILFKIFIISVAVAIAINSIYFDIMMRSGEINYAQAIPLIIERTLILDVIITIMSLPMLFLYHPNYWYNITGRLFLYFSGPLLFIVAIFFVGSSATSKTANLLTALVYLIVSAVFYYTLTKKNKRSGSPYGRRK